VKKSVFNVFKNGKSKFKYALLSISPSPYPHSPLGIRGMGNWIIKILSKLIN